MSRSFFDSNVLIYTFDHQDPAKRKQSLSLLNEINQENTPIVSTQVLQEFFWNTTRKFRPPLPIEEARAALRSFMKFDVVQVDVRLILMATTRIESTSISFWDALIVEAALSASAEVLYTEDLNHGQIIDGRLLIVNPFAVDEPTTAR